MHIGQKWAQSLRGNQFSWLLRAVISFIVSFHSAVQSLLLSILPSNCARSIRFLLSLREEQVGERS